MYIDPSQGSYAGLPPADIILVTDVHGDHFSAGVIGKLRKAGSVVLGPEMIVKSFAGARVIHNGEKNIVGPFTIEAVPMYNLKRGPGEGKHFHDKGRGNGYVVTFGGKRFYFSGDTEGVPEMRALKGIDVAFICMNVPYSMPPEEAADAVRAFHPKVVYPYHYRGSNLKVFESALAGSGIEVRIRDWYY